MNHVTITAQSPCGKVLTFRRAPGSATRRTVAILESAGWVTRMRIEGTGHRDLPVARAERYSVGIRDPRVEEEITKVGRLPLRSLSSAKYPRTHALVKQLALRVTA
jgi:hypothetical protein